MKKKYITPHIATARLMTTDNIAQFIVSSHAVGEDQGLAKRAPFFDEEVSDNNPWDEDN